VSSVEPHASDRSYAARVGSQTLASVRCVLAQRASAVAQGTGCFLWLSSAAGRTVVWMLVCNYLQAGIGFALNLWLANRLGSEGYGVLSYCLVVGGICATLVGFASDKTLVRDLIQARDRNAVFTASLVQRSVAALLVTSGCLGIAAWSSADEPTRTWAILLGAVWGTLMGLLPTAWLDARQEMRLSAALTLLERVVFAVLLIGLLSRPGLAQPILTALLCLAGSRLFGFVTQWGHTAESFRPEMRTGALRTDLIALTQGNAPVLGAAVASLMLTHVNQLFLEHQDGATGLAYYAIAFQLISLVTILQGQVLRFLTPRIAEITRPGTPSREMRRDLIRFSVGSGLITLMLAVPLLILAPWGLSLCFRPEYQAASTPLRILCVWAVLYGPALIVNQFLLCLRLTRAYLAVTVAGGGMALFLGQVLVPRLGASGVALSLLCSHAASMIAQGVLVARGIRSLEPHPLPGSYGDPKR